MREGDECQVHPCIIWYDLACRADEYATQVERTLANLVTSLDLLQHLAVDLKISVWRTSRPGRLTNSTRLEMVSLKCPASSLTASALSTRQLASATQHSFRTIPPCPSAVRTLCWAVCEQYDMCLPNCKERQHANGQPHHRCFLEDCVCEYCDTDGTFPRL